MHRLYELLRYVWCVISYCEPGGTTTTTIIVIRLRRLRSRVHAHDEPRRGQIFTHTPQGQLSLELIPEKNAQLAEAPPDVHDATTVSVFVFPPKNQRRLKMVALGEHVILIIRCAAGRGNKDREYLLLAGLVLVFKLNKRWNNFQVFDWRLKRKWSVKSSVEATFQDNFGEALFPKISRIAAMILMSFR